jgi:hypothetical protein
VLLVETSTTKARHPPPLFGCCCTHPKGQKLKLVCCGFNDIAHPEYSIPPTSIKSEISGKVNEVHTSGAF